jgi:hypothetical protein
MKLYVPDVSLMRHVFPIICLLKSLWCSKNHFVMYGLWSVETTNVMNVMRENLLEEMKKW